jgi:hypothetical protein
MLAVFDFSDKVIHVINISVIVVIVAIAVWIFIDSMKKNHIILNSFGWAVLALLFFPPIGIIIYFYKRKPHQ